MFIIISERHKYQRFLPPVNEHELCERMRQRVSAPIQRMPGVV